MPRPFAWRAFKVPASDAARSPAPPSLPVGTVRRWVRATRRPWSSRACGTDHLGCHRWKLLDVDGLDARGDPSTRGRAVDHDDAHDPSSACAHLSPPPHVARVTRAGNSGDPRGMGDLRKTKPCTGREAVVPEYRIYPQAQCRLGPLRKRLRSPAGTPASGGRPPRHSVSGTPLPALASDH